MAKSPWRDLDAKALARHQIEMDHRKTRWFPALFNRKVERMRNSPLNFLRGSAELYYQVLAEQPTLRSGPGPSGWITGDLHLLNFGAYRPGLTHDENAKESKAVFELNDFDEAVVGPWRFDVVRMLTSIVLGARECGFERATTEASMRAFCAAYTHSEGATETPLIVANLIRTVQRRTAEELLDDRTTVVRGKRRFVHDNRYVAIEKALFKEITASLTEFAESLPAAERPHREQLEVFDCALRISGTGSLGALRIAVVVSGKDPPNRCWLFDMKSEGKPSAKPVVPKQRWKKAERALVGMQACLEQPPKLSGMSRLWGRSMLVRRLTPQEDRIDFSQINKRSWSDVIRFLAALSARAHRRGSKEGRCKWTDAECETFISQAFHLAGLHDSVYVAYKSQTKDVRPMPHRPISPKILA